MKEMMMMLGLMLIALAMSFVGVIEHKREQKVLERRKIRDAQTKMKLQRKRDEFEAFQRLIETYKRDCAECFEYDYKQYLDCYPNDYNGKKKHTSRFDLKKPCRACGERDERTYQEAYQDILKEKPIRNLRVELQDFTVEEVMHLYSF